MDLPNSVTTTAGTSGSDVWATLLGDPQTVETGGVNNNEGVDFARYWAMYRILVLEEAKTPDYAIVFEYLQDVLELNSSAHPTAIKLYQIKKKDRGYWTCSDLCRCPKKRSGKSTKALTAKSILGKLYLAVEKVSKNVSSSEGTFISNVVCKVKVKDGSELPSYTRLSVVDLDDITHKRIHTRIAKELKKAQPLCYLSVLHLEQTIISPGSMRETVRGLVDEYLTSHCPQLPNVSGRLVETLFRSFAGVSGPKSGLTSLAEIIKAKGFTRSQFNSLVAELSRLRPFPASLDEVVGGLKTEGMPPRTANELRHEADRIKVELVNQPDTEQTYLWNTAVSEARLWKSSCSYTEIMNAITKRLEGEAKKRGSPVSALTSLRAVALLAIDYVDQEPQKANSKSSDKKE